MAQRIEATIAFNLGELKNGLSQMVASAKQGAESVNNVFKNAKPTIDTSGVTSGMQTVAQAAEKASASVAQLGKSGGLLSNLKSQFGELGGAAQSALGVLGGGALLGGFSALGSGISSIFDAGKKAIRTTQEMELAFTTAGVPAEKLSGVLSQTKKAASELADKYALSTGQVREYQLAAASLGGATGKQNTDLTRLAIGIQAATGGMVTGTQAIKIFTRGVADPENAEAIDKLTKKFPALGNALKSSGDVAGKTKAALDFLGPTLNKVEEQAQGPVGSFDRLQNTINKVAGTVGKGLIEGFGPLIAGLGNALIPVVNVIIGVFSELMKVLDPIKKAFEDAFAGSGNSAMSFGDTIQNIAKLIVSVLQPIVAVVAQVLAGWLAFQAGIGGEIFTAIGNAINNTASALSGFGGYLKGVWDSMGGFSGVIEKGKSALEALSPVLAAVGGYLLVVKGQTLAAAAATLFENEASTASKVVTMAVTAAKQAWLLITTPSIALQYAQAAATQVVTGAQWLLNAAMEANPIGLIVAGIAALAAGLVYAYNHIDTFREFINKAWEKIKEWGAAILNVVSYMNPFTAAFRLAYDNIKPFRDLVDWTIGKVVELWDNIKKLGSAIAGFFSSTTNGNTQTQKAAEEAAGASAKQAKSLLDQAKELQSTYDTLSDTQKKLGTQKITKELTLEVKNKQISADDQKAIEEILASLKAKQTEGAKDISKELLNIQKQRHEIENKMERDAITNKRELANTAAQDEFEKNKETLENKLKAIQEDKKVSRAQKVEAENEINLTISALASKLEADKAKIKRDFDKQEKEETLKSQAELLQLQASRMREGTEEQTKQKFDLLKQANDKLMEMELSKVQMGTISEEDEKAKIREKYRIANVDLEIKAAAAISDARIALITDATEREYAAAKALAEQTLAKEIADAQGNALKISQARAKYNVALLDAESQLRQRQASSESEAEYIRQVAEEDKRYTEQARMYEGNQSRLDAINRAHASKRLQIEQDYQQKTNKLYQFFNDLNQSLLDSFRNNDNQKAKEDFDKITMSLRAQEFDALRSLKNQSISFAEYQQKITDIAAKQSDARKKLADSESSAWQKAVGATQSAFNKMSQSLSTDLMKMAQDGKSWSDLLVQSFKIAGTAGLANASTLKDAGKAMVKSLFDTLQAMIPTISAMILGLSLASPGSIASFGTAGFAEWAALTAVLEGAVVAARAALGFADGIIGFRGKGSRRSDSNLAWISDGESVITADATDRNRSLLEYLNKGGNAQSFFWKNYQPEIQRIMAANLAGMVAKQSASFIDAAGKLYIAPNQQVRVDGTQIVGAELARQKSESDRMIASAMLTLRDEIKAVREAVQTRVEVQQAIDMNVKLDQDAFIKAQMTSARIEAIRG